MTDEPAIWRDLHALQTTMCLPLELPAYYASPAWARARTVLDVGTGHGDYLRQIQRRFPDKMYVGVDIDPNFIAEARHAGDGIRYEIADVMRLDGRFDFVIVRLLLQHLDDVPGALRSIARVTAAGGSALVIDALDELRVFVPPLPEFMRFFDAYRRNEQRAGRDRDVMRRLPELVRDAGAWTVESVTDVLIPSTFPGSLEVMRAVYSRVIDLLAPSLNGDCNHAALTREWAWWCGLADAYAQVGLCLTRLDRTRTE